MDPKTSSPATGILASTLLGLAILASCQSTEGSEIKAPSKSPLARSFRFHYGAATEGVPADAGSVRLWIPVPSSDRNQHVDNVRITGQSGPIRFDYSTDQIGSVIEKDGVRLELETHPIEGGRGRSLCATSNGTPIIITLDCDVTRLRATAGGSAEQLELREHLESDSMIPLEGKVAAVAASLPTTDDGLDMARSLYTHTLDRMQYDKPAGEAWGRGDAEWACDSRYGNCTDFHSYFMGLARAKGIPARFIMGFPIPEGVETVATIGGYHCWAEFWDEDYGWVPVDISEADKHPERADEYFGTLDFNRVTVTEGRDLMLNPAPSAGALNFFIYPYAEVDGVEWDRVKKSLTRTTK